MDKLFSAQGTVCGMRHGMDSRWMQVRWMQLHPVSRHGGAEWKWDRVDTVANVKDHDVI